MFTYPIKMKLKKDETPVDVYQIYDKEGSPRAVIFDIAQYKRNGSGWTVVTMSKLLPLDVPINHKEVVSKTQRNKAKKRLELIEATWKTSDGELYCHGLLDSAIEHELQLMEKEKEEEG